MATGEYALFVGTLFPVLGFLNICWFRFSYVADHFQYLASLGIITLAAAGAALLLDRWRLWNRPGGYAACLVLLAILASLTWHQSQVYADAETLYRATSDRNPDCWAAECNLGVALAARGQLDGAISHYQKALAINPGSVMIYNNLGTALATCGRFDEAIAQYQKALKIKPDCAESYNDLGAILTQFGRFDEAVVQIEKALEVKPDDVTAHYNLGIALADCGRVNEAITQYQKTLELKPDYAEAHNNLGNVLVSRGQIDEAIAHFQKALQLDPELVTAHDNLGVARSQREEMLKALAERRESLRSRPDDIALLNDTAWVLATNPNASIRNATEAVELAQRAVQLSDGREPAVLGTLAAAYAEAGRFPEAVQTAPRPWTWPRNRTTSHWQNRSRPRFRSTKPELPSAR